MQNTYGDETAAEQKSHRIGNAMLFGIVTLG